MKAIHLTSAVRHDPSRFGLVRSGLGIVSILPGSGTPYIASCLCALCFLFPGVTGAQQQDFSKVQIKATKIAGTVHMLEGSGGNIGVSVGEDGIIIVDDQFAPLAPKIRAALKELSSKPLKFVINTHFHGDHAGGNGPLSAEATILAHENVRKRLKDGTTVMGNPIEPVEKGALPVITFNDRATVHINGEDVRAIHCPNAHTDGDSVIFFTQSKVVHMGDVFVTYGFPFVDIGNGGSVSGMIAGVERVLELTPPDVKIIPGHGPLSTPADLRKYLEMLKETRALVAKAVKEGKSAQEIKKAQLLSKYEDFGKGYIKADAWIDVLIADLNRKAGATPK